MTGGFRFCDVDIADIGLKYAPTLADTYVYRPTQRSVHDQSFAGHDGGYFYGVTAKPKEFSLRCYFEETAIKNGLMTDIYDLFKSGRTGSLVFQQREWCWYTATVTNVDTSQMLNKENGFVVINMRAYYPFARTEYWTTDNAYGQDILYNSAALNSSAKIPPRSIITTGSMNAQDFNNYTILLYNPGTERAKLAIEIMGNCPDGVTIANATTRQECKLVSLDPTLITNGYIIVDALNGKVVKKAGNNVTYAYLFHDHGFIDLEPAYPIIRDVSAEYIEDSTTVTLADPVPNCVGKYIWVANAWHKIVSMSSSTSLTISGAAESSGEEITDIVLMNELTVTPDNPNNFSITRLKFSYLPTFT